MFSTPRQPANVSRRPSCCIGLAAAVVITLFSHTGVARGQATTYVVLGYNDLGMHCMNEDFSEIMILPPFNTLHATVISRHEGEPKIVRSGVTVRYTIPGNTHSVDKTNFWRYSAALLGTPLPPDVGVAGMGLSGTMTYAGHNDWSAVGIPLTPIDDSGRENPYPLGVISVERNGQTVASTQAVVPVSTEITCHMCHDTPGISTATDILRKHDTLHNTTLEQSKPVVCASCHADNALGAPGQAGISNFSSAMHSSHATRMAPAANLGEPCYACHPGVRTQCQRDVHFGEGITCSECHGGMAAVGDPAREPWVTEPRCTDCHSRAGFQFEQPGTLYRDSVGHQGVQCAACHGSPHAITPTVTEADNVQAIAAQGHAGKIDTCTVCHTDGPPDEFEHRPDDD